ncbi:MAG: YceI family protein [Planctomycetes bacterium]|nr:YceI family protein [Planctomycetota bacterium]
MKTLLLCALAGLTPFGLHALSSPPSAAVEPATAAQFTVDSGHSSTNFRIKHVVAPFWGRFNKVEGSVTWDAASADKCAVEISIDATSIDTNDGKRDDHLRGPDFFSAKEFPKLTFKSTKVAKKGDKLEVTGDFTMRGVTKSMTVPVEMTGEGESPFKDYRAGFEATFDIKRSDFGVKGYIPVISDEVRIIVALECVKS